MTLFAVNAHNIFDAAAGFGGYKESGFGRDGGKEGLYEYVKPSWMERPRPSLMFPTERAEWQSAVPGRPASVESSQIPNLARPAIPGVPTDHTFKVYIGGKQKRPDGYDFFFFSFFLCAMSSRPLPLPHDLCPQPDLPDLRWS